MKTAPRLALLLMLAGATPVQAAAWSSEQIPISDEHYLDARFLWIFNPPSTDARPGLRAHTYVKSRDGLLLEMSPYARKPSPLKSFVLVGKWWTILGDFVKNAGVIWTYRDTFYVEDAAGKTYKIDRQALSKYPDLARRLRNATISFDKVEITVQGVARNGATVSLTFYLGSQDFLFYPEGATPYMAAPGSPLKWSESVRVGMGSAPQDDKSLRAQWTSLVAIRDPAITITGLQIPEQELAAIAKAYEKREEKDKDLEKEIAALNPDAPLPGDVGRYRGGNDSFAEPFEETTAQVHRDPKTSEWMLRSKAGKTLATFGKEHWNLSALAGTKLFVLESEAGKAIVNRHGERQSISGADTFRTVESKDGALTVETVFQPGVKVVDVCNGNLGVYGPRLYSSSSEAIEIVNRAHRAWEEKKQRDWERSRSRAPRDEPPQFSICLTSSHWVTGVVRHRLDLGLRVTSAERGFLIDSR